MDKRPYLLLLLFAFSIKGMQGDLRIAVESSSSDDESIVHASSSNSQNNSEQKKGSNAFFGIRKNTHNIIIDKDADTQQSGSRIYKKSDGSSIIAMKEVPPLFSLLTNPKLIEISPRDADDKSVAKAIKSCRKRILCSPRYTKNDNAKDMPQEQNNATKLQSKGSAIRFIRRVLKNSDSDSDSDTQYASNIIIKKGEKKRLGGSKIVVANGDSFIGSMFSSNIRVSQKRSLSKSDTDNANSTNSNSSQENLITMQGDMISLDELLSQVELCSEILVNQEVEAKKEREDAREKYYVGLGVGIAGVVVAVVLGILPFAMKC